MDREMDSTHDDSMEDYLDGGSAGNDNGGGKEGTVNPLAAFHPILGHINMDGGFPGLVQDRQDSSVHKGVHLFGVGSGNLEMVDMGSVSKHMGEAHTDKEQDTSGNENRFIVHGVDGPFLMDKNKWAKMVLTTELGTQD